MMSAENKATLLRANGAVSAGRYDEFIQCCTDDTDWTFMGDVRVQGKSAVLDYMRSEYVKPPIVTVENLISDGDQLVAIGEISMYDKDGQITTYHYCDVWRFVDGKMSELKAYVVKKAP